MSATYPEDRFDDLSDALSVLTSRSANASSALRELLDVAKDSFAVLTADPATSRRFFRRFYERLLGRSPRARELFEQHLGADPSRWTRQLDVLHLAIQLLLAHAEYGWEAVRGTNVLSHVAADHGARFGLTSDDYDDFGEELVGAVLDLDPRAGEPAGRATLRRAWKQVLRRGLAYMSRPGPSGPGTAFACADPESVPAPLRAEGADRSNP